jgi:2-hydroxychromene-2-carboxylate isomerase
MREVILYTDYKSPFAYLAKDLAYALEADYDVRLDWRHFTLNIPDFFQDVDTRTERSWRKVKYLYMDARRLANKRGLTVLGPQKIFDSSIAGIAMYWALDQGPAVFRGYNDRVHERFFMRQLDIEQVDLIEAVLAEAGAEVSGFSEFLEGEGRQRHDRIVKEGEEAGVFGVPTFVYEGELFWGTDRIDFLKERLDAA